MVSYSPPPLRFLSAAMDRDGGLSPHVLSKAQKRKARKHRKLEEIRVLGEAAPGYVADPTRRILQGRACRRRRANWAAEEPQSVNDVS